MIPASVPVSDFIGDIEPTVPPFLIEPLLTLLYIAVPVVLVVILAAWFTGWMPKGYAILAAVLVLLVGGVAAFALHNA